ncbi:unnamed protein product [Owenia fusiformis]|uniref:OTU domain-containing protein n=1 Tax=Owenia fusiformis TaxID=6347 RepID=A0A8S4PUV3_OWEFU|nr:unnamed protein product [Owenia fusiformis]
MTSPMFSIAQTRSMPLCNMFVLDEVVSIRGDGRCLFRALARAVGRETLTGTAETQAADRIRRELVDKFEAEREKWKERGRLAPIHMDWRYTSIDAEMEAMKKSTAEGGTLQLMIAAELLNFDIGLYQRCPKRKGSLNTLAEIDVFPCAGQTNRRIHLLYVPTRGGREGHYNLLSEYFE